VAEPADRPKRPGGKPNGRRPDAGRPKRGAPSEKRLWTSGGKPARGDRDARHPEPPEDRDPYGIKAVRTRHDDPEIPDDVQAKDLDRVARAQLRTLSKENAEEVARHLAMAARLIDEDPQLAHRHAVSAARRAGRIAVVRETLAITAYSIGDFALALRELRTYRRISGRDDQLPMMVDSERGLGRPDKALELARSVPRQSLDVHVRVELAIAMSGARLDLGQNDAALTELQIPELDPDTAFSYSPALFDAYATVLEELGRTDEAEQWFERSDRATAALTSDEDSDENAEQETIEIAEEVLEAEDDSIRPDAPSDERAGDV
jgi:tetratricopeptide (TPR) repeat protein